MLKKFCLSLCGVSGSWCTQGFVWALWASLEGTGFDSVHRLPSPTVLLWLVLCPWTWGMPLQCLPSCWGFSDLGRGVSPHEVTGISPHEITMWLHSNQVTGQSLRQLLSKPEIPPNSLIIILTWSFFLPWGFPFASWMWTLFNQGVVCLTFWVGNMSPSY